MGFISFVDRMAVRVELRWLEHWTHLTHNFEGLLPSDLMNVVSRYLSGCVTVNFKFETWNPEAQKVLLFVTLHGWSGEKKLWSTQQGIFQKFPTACCHRPGGLKRGIDASFGFGRCRSDQSFRTMINELRNMNGQASGFWEYGSNQNWTHLIIFLLP